MEEIKYKIRLLYKFSLKTWTLTLKIYLDDEITINDTPLFGVYLHVHCMFTVFALVSKYNL